MFSLPVVFNNFTCIKTTTQALTRFKHTEVIEDIQAPVQTSLLNFMNISKINSVGDNTIHFKRSLPVQIHPLIRDTKGLNDIHFKMLDMAY